MDHSNHRRLSGAELTPDVLQDVSVFGPDDEDIGTVSHVHGSGSTAQVIINVGGFLGIGAKSIALTAHQLEFMRGEGGEVHAVTSFTKDQLRAMPEYVY
ncbi:PRC-barrel domain containing protein [Mesorhizobium sp. ANAO-SY3R2]|uniref:PRC-barrel domain containing protein n=1 Tax=Mesorhizobium sp. ANAO-SY3R2 TaxID=3166644 RepID=UPI0036712F4B